MTGDGDVVDVLIGQGTRPDSRYHPIGQIPDGGDPRPGGVAERLIMQ
jgi:hypothetical protein